MISFTSVTGLFPKPRRLRISIKLSTGSNRESGLTPNTKLTPLVNLPNMKPEPLLIQKWLRKTSKRKGRSDHVRLMVLLLLEYGSP